MTLSFRNLDVDPSTPVADWPYEALVTAIERGTVADWARVTRVIRSDPWGEVARQVEDYLAQEQPYGVGPLLGRAIVSARAAAVASEREEVAARVRAAITRSGLGQAGFARKVGTSRTRLSTYASGRVIPSAAMLVRMERVGGDQAGLDRAHDIPLRS